MSTPTTEADVLQREVRRLEAEGYDVFVHPRPPQTPEFLGSFVPDAIATGKGKNLILEVKRSGTLGDRALVDLAAEVRKQTDWELRIVLVSPTSSAGKLPLQSAQAVQSAIEEIAQLRDSGALRAAFLLAWATLEAEARRLVADELGRPQTPGRVVQILGQEGYLTPDETDRIRTLADMRNRLVHGELDIPVSRESLDQLLQTLQHLGQQDGAESTQPM
jgi:uncharacterized protein YutE (UPF0331/DUF86 family)